MLLWGVGTWWEFGGCLSCRFCVLKGERASMNLLVIACHTMAADLPLYSPNAPRCLLNDAMRQQRQLQPNLMFQNILAATMAWDAATRPIWQMIWESNKNSDVSEEKIMLAKKVCALSFGTGCFWMFVGWYLFFGCLFELFDCLFVGIHFLVQSLPNELFFSVGCGQWGFGAPTAQ